MARLWIAKTVGFSNQGGNKYLIRKLEEGRKFPTFLKDTDGTNLTFDSIKEARTRLLIEEN